MKRILLFLTCFLTLFGVSRAEEEKSYTITFMTGTNKDGTQLSNTNVALSDIFTDTSISYVSSYNDPKTAYYSSTNGLRLGSGSNVGSITLNLTEEAQVAPTKIVANIAFYGSDQSAAIGINTSSTTTVSTAGDYTVTYNNPTKISTLSLYMKRGYIKSVTVFYNEDDGDDNTGGGTGGGETDPPVDLNPGGDDKVTFDFTNPYSFIDEKSIELSKTDGTVVNNFSNGNIDVNIVQSTEAQSGQELRFFQQKDFRTSAKGGALGHVFTISTSDNSNITKIEFTGSPLNFTSDPSTLSGSEWVGDSKSVSFTTTGQVTITKMVVTYKSNSSSTITPVLKWMWNGNDETGNTVTVKRSDENLPILDSSVKDLTISYKSSNTSVATVDNGTITILGVGETEITATSDEVEDQYESATAKFTLNVVADDYEAPGTKENPYTVEDYLANYKEDSTTKVWVQGYIVGFYNNTPNFSANGAPNTNLIIAATSEANSNSQYIPVQLPSGNIRNDLNLADHAENLGRQVKIEGTRENYFSIKGLKNASAYEWIIDENEPKYVTLSFDEKAYTFTIGTEFTSPKVTMNPDVEDAEITYSSDNGAIASVNSETGELTLNKQGTTTITAKFAGNTKYKAGEASYELNVIDPNAEGTEFVLVKDINQLGDVSECIIVYTEGNVAMGPQNGDFRTPINVIIDNEIIKVDETSQVALVVIDKVDEYYTLNTKEGYLNSPNSGSDKGSNTLRSSQTLTDNCYATISISENNNASIVFEKSTNVSKTIKYNKNSGSERFSCYSSGQQDVQLYIDSKYVASEGDQDPGLEFRNEAGEKVTEWTVSLNDENPTFPTLYAPEGLEIEYFSDVEDLVIVIDGEYLLGDDEGDVIITAKSKPLEGKFKEGEASYILHIVEQIEVEDANTDSYTITFDDIDSDASTEITSNTFLDYIIEGKDFVDSASSIYRVYKGTTGLKFGSNSALGSIDINLSEKGKVRVQRITVHAKSYNEKNNGVKLSVNGKTHDVLNYQEVSDYDFDFDGSIIETISIETERINDNRGYIKGLTIYFEPDYYLDGDIKLSDKVLDPSFKFQKSSNEEGLVYILEVGSIKANSKFYLKNNIEEKIGLEKEEIINAGHNDNDGKLYRYDTKRPGYDLVFDKDYVNVIFYYYPTGNTLEIDGTISDEVSDLAIHLGNDKTNQSGEVKENEINISIAPNQIGALIYVISPKDDEAVNGCKQVYYKRYPKSNPDNTRRLVDADYVAATYDAASGAHLITLPEGKGEISLDYDDNPLGAKLYSFSVTKDNVPLGVDGIEAEEGEAEYFTLQGVKVANPEKGIYIKVVGGKAVKVVR